MQCIAAADLVIESVVERTDIKRQVLADIEGVVGPDTVIATNTSTNPIAKLAEVLTDPARFCGIHFFNPVDAVDATGIEYELKTVNIRYASRRGAKPQFTTHHHLNPTIIAKYRSVHWLFATYDGIELVEIYFMPSIALEPLFAIWEQKWHDKGGRDLNNPKIPMQFVAENGQRIFYSPVPKSSS